MKILAGAVAVSALLMVGPAMASGSNGGPKGTPNYYGYVPHWKTKANHPGGHSSVTGHRNNAGASSSSGGHVHNGCHGHPQKPAARCFPPGHCKSINKGYYGPPGQKGR